MAIARAGQGRKYAERPPECIECGLSAWWNGIRVISAVRRCATGVEHLTGIIRRRARCPSTDCAQGSWTIYEEQGYPHRVFELAVVVSAVSAVVFGGATQSATAATHQCSRDSVRRWKRWVEQLAEPADLLRACTELEPDGHAGGLAPSTMARAASVLHLLDRLAELLAFAGVRIGQASCGLIRVVRHLLSRFGEVFYVVKSSPPLRADMGRLGI